MQYIMQLFVTRKLEVCINCIVSNKVYVIKNCDIRCNKSSPKKLFAELLYFIHLVSEVSFT